MAFSNAEIQRRYRERQKQDGGGERLNTVVGISAKRQLERLARHYGVTQRAMLERVLADTESATVDGLADTAAYYDGAANITP